MANAETRSPVKKALFVRLRAKPGKEADLEAFLRNGLAAVMEEPDTTTWYAVCFGQCHRLVLHVKLLGIYLYGRLETRFLAPLIYVRCVFNGPDKRYVFPFAGLRIQYAVAAALRAI